MKVRMGTLSGERDAGPHLHKGELHLEKYVIRGGSRWLAMSTLAVPKMLQLPYCRLPF